MLCLAYCVVLLPAASSWLRRQIACAEFVIAFKLYNIPIYLDNCGIGGRIARPGQRFSDAGPITLLAALRTGNHVIPVRSL